jgi:hypothetical protein
MPLRVIELDPADTFYSVRDRLLRGGRGRAVLVLPPHGAPGGGVGLVLLRRLADRERLEIGLVTADRALARQARALGLPAFSTLTLAEHFRPGWWRARRRSERLGFAAGADGRIAAKEAIIETGHRRSFLVLVIVLILFVTGLMAAAAIYALPHATITLRPITQPAQVIIDLTADPAATEPAGRVVPARALGYSQSWEARGPSMGDAGADQSRIRALALQGLGAAAPGILAARLDPGEMLVPASVRFDVIDESFDQAGDVSILTLRAALEGLVVNAADVNRLAHNELAGALPAGFVPDAASLRVRAEASGGSADHLQITAGATGRADIEPAQLAALLRGRRASDAAHHLSATLPLAEPPAFDVGPGWWREWFGRLPLRAERIRVKVIP